MPRYKFRCEVERAVTDTIDVVVEAECLDEAQDVAYDVVTEYPESSLSAKMYFVRSRHWHDIDRSDISFVEIENEKVDDDD